MEEEFRRNIRENAAIRLLLAESVAPGPIKRELALKDVKNEEDSAKPGKKVKPNKGFCYLNIARLLKVPALKCDVVDCVFSHFSDNLKSITIGEAKAAAGFIKKTATKKLVKAAIVAAPTRFK